MNAGGAFLLAAGRGRRMGGPKAWLEFGGRSLLQTQIEFLLGLFEPERISVSIQREWLERCRSLQRDVLWVPVDPDAPPLASLQALLRARPLPGWSFLHHVDMPVWERGLFEALDRAVPTAERAGEEAISPVFQGKKGHPLLLSPRAGRGLLMADPRSDRLDLWLRGREVREVDVPHPAVHRNWNVRALIVDENRPFGPIPA